MQPPKTESPSVRVVAGSRSWTPSVDLVLPPTNVVIEVTGHTSQSVSLDGKRHRLTPGRAGLIGLDLSRSTGYHRLVVEEEVYWFATEDAKLKLEGIEQMLSYLRTSGTGWTGQALFSDGSGLRDSHVVYAWLDNWADRTLQAIEALLAAPRSVVATTRRLSRRGGSGVLMAPSLRLLRSAPKQYLSERADGLLPVGGARYDPLRLVTRQRTLTLDTPAHRRMCVLLNRLHGLVAEVLSDDVSAEVRARSRSWDARLDDLRSKPILGAIHPGSTAFTAPRQPEEMTDRRYRQCFEAASDLHRNLGWTPSRTPLTRYSYIQKSDAIYQAFAGTAVAEALGLRQTSVVLGEKSPAFQSNDFSLYYDVPAVAGLLRSWRSASIRPDTSRPDLLLHEHATGRVALMDAKYRVDSSGEASEDSRKEVAAYMALYGLNAISILFPGAGQTAQHIRGHGQEILEIPVRPGAHLPASLGAIVPELLATLQAPPY